MKIVINHATSAGNISNFVPVITEPHNVKFHRAHNYKIDLQIFRFPKKAILEDITRHTKGDIKNVRGFVRIVIRTTYPTIHFIVKYDVKTPESSKSYNIKEEERVYIMDAYKEEIIALFQPFLNQLDAVNSKKDAQLFKSSFNRWASITLETFIEKMNFEQREKALKLLVSYFNL